MSAGSKVFVAGHNGMVGSAVVRRLRAAGRDELILSPPGLDLRDQAATSAFFESASPELVVLAAARVGGIKENIERPAELLYDNLMIASNVIESARRAGTRRLIFLGSSCMYPAGAEQPFSESSLLSGPPEPTNEGFAIAKIAGHSLCRFYRQEYELDCFTLIPNNAYGPGDDFLTEKSHFLSALMRKLHVAKCREEDVELWGSGSSMRELLFVDDLAEAIGMLLDDGCPCDAVNVGSGEEYSIAEYAGMVAEAVGFRGRIAWDRSHPDGVSRKMLDSSRIRELGWRPRTPLLDGLRLTYAWFLENVADGSDARSG